MLRLWRDGDEPEDWRASMEDVRTHRRELFGTLASLIAFLEARTSTRSPAGAEDRADGQS